LEIFQVEKIESASENIAIHLSKEVLDNDVILTYGNSPVVQKALEFALSNGVKFTVIIIENDQQSGKALVDSLTKKGIQCTYTSLSSLSYILQDATRIWLNSEALLIDGSVLSNSGTGQIALASQSQKIPTSFFGESYKVWDKVLFNSTQWNVLDEVASDSALTTVKFKYDVTPYTLVSRIITESGEISTDKLSLTL
jgi:translation initiation factor 2B subunit (eIF-2B alpha/beta/delta family)